METKNIPITSASLSYDAGGVITLMMVDQILNNVSTYEEARAIIGKAISELQDPFLKSAAEFLVGHGYKHGEHEIGLQRNDDGQPCLMLTPVGQAVIGSEQSASTILDVNGIPMQ